jgi:hypothetical protein
VAAVARMRKRVMRRAMLQLRELFGAGALTFAAAADGDEGVVAISGAFTGES